MAKGKFICIHGHFYQPTRENPWLDEIEPQDSASPFHDWNQKITKECYRANALSPLTDPKTKITHHINNYERISFNFGPTLFSWLSRNESKVCKAIIAADKQGRERFSGEGPAIAQCYNHMIMPLANSRDKHTQVIWGIKDFQSRFKRMPQGMWLPETAIDIKTLEVLAEYGIKFTILGQHQASGIRKIGEQKWKSTHKAMIDPKMAYLCRLPSKKEIALFFYDSGISHEIAFGKLLENGGNFANRLVSRFSGNSPQAQLVHVATDGETFGHHHRFGNMALSYCLYCLEKNPDVKLTVYAEFLKRFPPTYEVKILENSSWSCSHGLERWRADCGCNSGTHPDWSQAWRLPLREAMDWLRDNLAKLYEIQMGRLVKEPWKARDEFIEFLLNRTDESLEGFFNRHIKKTVSEKEKTRMINLLELQRQAMLMFTSCGWFCDDISGIESVQIMRHAARAMQLARLCGAKSYEAKFISFLRKAPSNNKRLKNGAKIYAHFVKPAIRKTNG